MRAPPVSMAHIATAARERGVGKAPLRHALGRLGAVAAECHASRIESQPVVDVDGRLVIWLSPTQWDELLLAADIDPDLRAATKRAHALTAAGLGATASTPDESPSSTNEWRANTGDDTRESARSHPIVVHEEDGQADSRVS